ncbi:MAG: hypothetical protein ACKO40_07610 [Planctomycetaceae bacterium]
MSRPPKSPAPKDAAAIVLGYANFSSGSFDPAVWRALSQLYADREPADDLGVVVERPDTPAHVAATLRERLDQLAGSEPAFADSRQARWTLATTFDLLLPAYRLHHADLLEHQPPGAIERPFFVMAAIRALLAEAAPDDDPDAAVRCTIDRLDDYVGWRPLAVLENGRLSAPYPHERVRPIPLYVAGAGAAHGRYRDLVAGAIAVLNEVPVELLRQADFDLAALEELAIDPRAFDFMHPAASRPNYLFGLWDPGRIDDRGLYRRMVVQQATLDGILSWPDVDRGADRTPAGEAERRWESSAVLAGVMLMASGLSGHGPGAPQAALPLAELLPRIAAYRDEFYRRLLATLPEAHRQRLTEEAQRMRQPFGGVRRHINAVLAGRRARQVENVALAAALARLGRAAAAEGLVAAVPAASARLLARITGHVVASQQQLWRNRDSAAAVDELARAEDLLLRAIDCGAVVDPWNILGLSGQFPLHEASGESLPDPRVSDLVSATEAIMDGYATAWRQASLAGDGAAATRAEAALSRCAAWWDRYATTTVSGVPHLSGRECLESAREVIGALGRRRDHGAEAPPPAFWREEVAAFSSPRSHAQAAATLLDEGDLDGGAGLLVHWASLLEGDAIGRSGPAWLSSATRWVTHACQDASPQGRLRVRRFLERVEANIGGVVDVIAAAATAPGRRDHRGADDDETDDGESGGEEERLAAAYESMVWRDSADDGVDGGMIDMDGAGGGTTGELATVEDSAEFLRGVLRLFRSAVTAWCASDAAAHRTADADEIDVVTGWRQSFRGLRRTMVRAATVVALRDQVPPPGMSAAEFDRLRWHRDAAAERLIEAAVQAGETRWLLSARQAFAADTSRSTGVIGRLFAAFIRGDAAAAAEHCRTVCERLVGRPVLYVPLARGGRPDRVVRARGRERLLERMATCLPRVGLVSETIAVVQLAKSLESRRPAGGASVSEFDRVFEAATTALVERIVESAEGDGGDEAARTARILDGLALLVPRLLETWLTHARQLRLSVLERLRDDRSFAATREFVERYGAGLFTQHVLSPSSLRGILRGGVGHWIDELLDRSDADDALPAGRRPERLLEDLRSGVLPVKQAVSRLRLVLESVAENHAEYRDWNSTTTQSDRGECLHILLDYLRVKAEHDRIAWTLRPVTMAHRVLARRGAAAAAEAWRERLREETRDTAGGLVTRLDHLEGHWSVKLASIGDRVRRPFTAMLEQDELEALVEPAVTELLTGAPAGAGAALEQRSLAMLGLASGSGVEVPDWLERLSQAVERATEDADALPRHGHDTVRVPTTLAAAVPWLPMPWPRLTAALGG